MDRSPLGFLTKARPEIRYAEGEMSLEARAGGTIRNPVLSGAARIDLPALRFSDPALPGIANFQSQLTFEKNQITVGKLGGEIGGGPFGVTGKVSLAKLTEPVLDLHASSKNLLIQRNNALTVRANIDLLIQGPAKAANMSGVVGITNSRFFREVEILPIGLPGRPTRRVPKMNPQLVLPPALKDWHFNITIRTDDPFKVRSNLAQGGAQAELLFNGTGAKPSLTGGIEIQNFAATLPFSKMNVDYGYITFTQNSGLNPALNIHGTSELRDYLIDIYIQGTAQDPKTIMTSDPPLPQEDIVALLATGATVKEIGGSPDVLAGRAAILLFDKIYRKIFKKNAPTSDEPVPNRLQFDFGGVSTTTGKQELTTQFKLTDQIYLLGEVGIEGSVGGKIKYVLRFR
jgi:autotransporter translocation and assembly factor TamB